MKTDGSYVSRPFCATGLRKLHREAQKPIRLLIFFCFFPFRKEKKKKKQAFHCIRSSQPERPWSLSPAPPDRDLDLINELLRMIQGELRKDFADIITARKHLLPLQLLI